MAIVGKKASDAEIMMETKPQGPYALGYTVRVWWDGDKKFYNAKVKKYTQVTDRHVIQYISDNFIEDIDLSESHIHFFRLKNEKEVKENEKLWKLYFARLNPNAPKKPKTAYNLYYSSKMNFFIENNICLDVIAKSA